MLDVDNPAPASPPAGHARPRRSSPLSRLGSGGGPDRRVLIGGIAGAVVLGLLIGFLTASSGGGPASKKPTATPPSAVQSVPSASLAPAVSEVGQRSSGAHSIKLDHANRLALNYAYYQAYRQGELRLRSGLRVAQVEIPEGVYYGVEEGTTAAADVYWAVGSVYFRNVAGQDATGWHEWRRQAGGPWEYLGAGCGQVPTDLRTVWGPHACA